MLENLLFSVNRVMPYFFLVLLGIFLRRKNILPEPFFSTINRFTYKVSLPCQLFYNVASVELSRGEDSRFLLLVFIATAGSFVVIWLATELFYHKNKLLIGTIVQGSFRGNFVLLGIPLVSSVLGVSAVQKASIATIIVAPLYNGLSVVALLMRGKKTKQSIKEVLRSIAENPLITGIFLGLICSLLRIRFPFMVGETLSVIGATTTPLGLISIGGMLVLSDATARLGPALYASAFKLLIVPAFIMALAIPMGFRGDELLVLFTLGAAPVAISSYAMACELGGDGPLASNILILTTFASAFTLAAGVFLLRNFALI